jgi:hypothetical protein
VAALWALFQDRGKSVSGIYFVGGGGGGQGTTPDVGVLATTTPVVVANVMPVRKSMIRATDSNFFISDPPRYFSGT